MTTDPDPQFVGWAMRRRPPVKGRASGARILAMALHWIEAQVEAGDVGYEELRHRARKLSDWDRLRLRQAIQYEMGIEIEGDRDRASGACVCPSCGCEYWDHPMAEEIIGAGGRPFLHRLCDGTLRKL